MKELVIEGDKVVSVPALNVAAIAAAAEKWVHKHVDFTTPETTAVSATKIVDKATVEAQKHRLARDKAAWTVSQQYHMKRGANLPSMIGVNRNRWARIRNAMSALAPAPTPDPFQVLWDAANKTATLTARIDAATKVRDAALRDIAAEGAKNYEIANLIGRHQSRISHMRSGGLLAK